MVVCCGAYWFYCNAWWHLYDYTCMACVIGMVLFTSMMHYTAGSWWHLAHLINMTNDGTSFSMRNYRTWSEWCSILMYAWHVWLEWCFSPDVQYDALYCWVMNLPHLINMINDGMSISMRHYNRWSEWCITLMWVWCIVHHVISMMPDGMSVCCMVTYDDMSVCYITSWIVCIVRL